MCTVKDAKTLIDRFSQWGRTEENGITRLLYDDSWMAMQSDVKRKMCEIGMSAGFDRAGNVIGRMMGRNQPERIVATGSHGDTVINGGTLDGQLGVIAGILAVKRLVNLYGPPRKTIEVVSFAEEEGSRFPYTFWGSKYYTGLACEDDVKDLADEDGIGFLSAREGAGFQPDGAVDRTSSQNLEAFVELHVEQGDVLHRGGLPVGVVGSIVAQQRYSVTLKGAANHAGTTMMKYRKDALMGFVKISEKAMEKACEWGDPLVLTFGKINAKPNVSNVISGEVFFTIDCRHTCDETLDRFCRELVADMKQTATDLDLDIEVRRELKEPAVPMDENIVQVIERACRKRNIPYKNMHSGAGHDSQILASKCNTGMIFVPSIDGISHNPKEATEIEDIAVGIEILSDVLYELAY